MMESGDAGHFASLTSLRWDAVLLSFVRGAAAPALGGGGIITTKLCAVSHLHPHWLCERPGFVSVRLVVILGTCFAPSPKHALVVWSAPFLVVFLRRHYQ